MKTFTQLVTGDGGFTALSNNSSAANVLLGKSLINDQHRYLLEKYFDNERTATISTIGAMNLTLTDPINAGSVAGTLSSPWAYSNCHQFVNFSGGDQRDVTFVKGSATITWSVGLNQDATINIATIGVQYYPIPANISKIKNDTINVGQLSYQTKPIQTRSEWDFINFLPYTSDIPSYNFIWNGTLGIFPIPSTTGNIITFNYKTRVPNLSLNDYSTGTLQAGGAEVGSTSITGLSTSWITGGGFPGGPDLGIFNLNIRINPPNGDGLWYPIYRFVSETSLELSLPIIDAPNISDTTTYTIGQLPLLNEDFHDMLVYGALMIYYSSIVNDTGKFKMYDALYKERLELLKDYAGTKQVNVDLGSEPQIVNPNLFIMGS